MLPQQCIMYYIVHIPCLLSFYGCSAAAECISFKRSHWCYTNTLTLIVMIHITIS